VIIFKEIIKDIPINDIPINIQHNIEDLLLRMNLIRASYGKPMIITSGLRTDADQRRINPKHLKSKHLIGKACDVSDPNQTLQSWLTKNVVMLEIAGLWCEDFSATPSWVHFQSEPPKSGKRFFLP
jgi:uncharacterized protein YcbK (DUF882 family)